MKYFFSSSCRALRWVAVGLWLSCWLLAKPALATGPALLGAGATPSLAEALNPDGTLRAGAHGSFDARHFVLHTAPDGRPSFSPASLLGTGDDNWQDNFRLPGTDGTVYVVLPVGSAVYIGGYFTRVGGIKANCIAKWDGTQWSALGVGAPGVVNALCATGTDLYVAASFTASGGGSASGVAKWNGTTWSTLAGNATSTRGYTPVIQTLAVTGTSLYVGGLFDTIGGVAANNIARWDGTAWNTLGTGTTNGTSYKVWAVAIVGSAVYVGGSFTTAGGVPANNLARWDGTSWNKVGTGTDNGVNEAVLCLVVAGADLYVGGIFSKAGSVPANSIAKWSGGAWSSFGMGSNNGVSTAGGVYSIVVAGTTVYVGGGFTVIGDNKSGYGVARWDGTNWNVMGTAQTPGVTANNFFVYAFSIALVGNSLYAGGTFIEAGGIVAKHIARWDGTAWNVVGANANGADSEIYAVAVAGTTVYVGGYFTAVGNVPANQVAKWDGTHWSALSATTTYGVVNGVQGVNGSQGIVYALAVAGSTVYAAGLFGYAGGVAVNNIAKWDGTRWSALGTGLANSTNSTAIPYVYALAVSGTTLYAGGEFAVAGGNAASRVAKWNGTTWSALGTGTANGANATVYALAASGTSVYVGGAFTTAGGLAANHIAKWDGTTWSTLGTGSTNGLSGGAYALTISGTDLYVGGSFTTAGGVTVNSVARWDGTAWTSLGTGAAAGVNSTVRAIGVLGTNVYVGGSFTRAGGAAAARVAKWDGTTWSTFGTGLNADVRGLAAGPGTLVNVGGLFTAVGDESKLSYSFGIYNDVTLPLLATKSASASNLTLSVYPNPSAGNATLAYYLPTPATVSAEVVDAVGRQVATVLVNAPQSTGAHTLTISTLRPGLYTVHLHYAGKATSCQLVVE